MMMMNCNITKASIFKIVQISNVTLQIVSVKVFSNNEIYWLYAQFDTKSEGSLYLKPNEKAKNSRNSKQ